ncbi:MAG: regulatory protein RecX [Ornithinimicrobium sp.]
MAAARAALAAATSGEAFHGDHLSDDGSHGAGAGAGARTHERALAGPKLTLVNAGEASATRSNEHESRADGSSGPGVAEARQIALRQLAMGPRSRYQLTEKMTARGCQPRDIASVLDRMTEVGLVDDAAYADMFVRAKREGPGLATSALRHELRKKGVPEDIAELAVTPASGDDERARAQELVQVRLRRMVGLDREVQMRRLAGFLARKGYPPGVALSVVREAVDALPEHQRD